MKYLREFYVQNCKLEDLVRLCVYLKIPDGSDFQRSSLVNWLVYEGYVEPDYRIGRMY